MGPLVGTDKVMRHRAPLVLVFSLACAAQAGDPPSIVGVSDDRAAAIATEVACEYIDRCGEVSITCADCDTSGDCGCDVEITEVTYDQCSDVALPQLSVGFACMTLTADEQAAVDACLQGLGEWACPDVDAEDPAALPDGCDVLQDIRYRCAYD